MRIEQDRLTGFPLWRGEPVREDDRWVIGPFHLTEPEHKVPEVGEEVAFLGGGDGSVRLPLTVLDVQHEGNTFLLLGQVVR